MWTRERPAGELPSYALTTMTLPTRYVGRLAFKPIMRDLAECARQERVQLNVDTRRWLFTVATTITVSGDAHAVERFGWFTEMVISRYSIAWITC
jgi:hypothetical protein